ncbi:MAG: flippase [candidate division WOR-3 bacterium]
MKRATKNAAFLLIGEVVTRLLGFLVSALLARRLGIDGFGQVGFAFSVMSYGVIVTKFGLLTVGIREAARDRTRIPHLVSNVLSLRLLLSLAATAAIVCFALLVRKDQGVRLLLILFSTGVVAQTFMLEWLFTGIERTEFVALGHVLTNALYFVLVALLVRGPHQILLVPLALAAATIVAALVLAARYAAEFGMPRPGFDRDAWKQLAMTSWPVGVASVLTQIYVNFGIIALALLRTDKEAGLFTAAQRLVFFLLMLDRVFQAVFLPMVSRYYKSAPDRLPGLVGTAVRVIIVLTLPLCIGLSLLARPAVIVVFGNNYLEAAVPVVVLVWFLPLSLLTTLAGYTLLASGQERRFCLNTGVGVALALALSVAGIVVWGVTAAAVALVIGEACMLILMGRDFLRLCRPQLDRRMFVPLLGGLGVAAVLVLLRNWNWMVAAAASAVIYLAVLLLGRGIGREDLGLAEQ